MKDLKGKTDSKKLTIAIFLGLILGIGYGLIAPGRLEATLPALKLIAGLYMNALNMMIYPLVFCSLVLGIKEIGSISSTGKIGAQTILYFTGTTLLASILGLFLPRALGLGQGVNIQMMEAEVNAVKFTSILDTLQNLIPSNPVAAFSNGNMLQVLAFAIIVGLTCLSIKEKAEPFLALVDSVNAIASKIISVVILFTPIGVFSSVANVVYANGTDTIVALGGVLAAIYITYILYVLIVYGGLVKFVGKVGIRKFFLTIMPASLNAFGTCSSSATLPISKKCADELGVPNEVSSLALPLGATINMDAVSILMSFMIVFFANACNIEVTLGLMVVVMISNTLLSVGTPGVPGGAIAAFAALSSVAGLPPGIMGVYISVNTLCDMGATCANVIGDIACATAMSKTVDLPNVEVNAELENA